jgi:hypothetical protein
MGLFDKARRLFLTGKASPSDHGPKWYKEKNPERWENWVPAEANASACCGSVSGTCKCSDKSIEIIPATVDGTPASIPTSVTKKPRASKLDQVKADADRMAKAKENTATKKSAPAKKAPAKKAETTAKKAPAKKAPAKKKK